MKSQEANAIPLREILENTVMNRSGPTTAISCTAPLSEMRRPPASW